MIAYRLGTLPTTERTNDHECLPAGPRINLTDAQQLRVSDGTLFSEASEEQVMQWFVFLCEQAGVSGQVCNEMLSGVDLSEFDYRWWALNEIMELGSVRDVIEGKVREPVILCPLPDAINHKQLARIVGEYGLGVTNPKKPDGTAQVYAQQYSRAHRCKIYICALSQLGNGQVTEQMVRRKLEKRGLSVLQPQERKVA